MDICRNRVIAIDFVAAMVCGAAVMVACLGAGCVELGIITPIGTPAQTVGDHPSIVGGDEPPLGDGAIQAPIASLAVSNSTPQLNEEVILTCRVANGSGTGARFDFNASPSPGTGLIVNAASGRASFIVTESDLNTTLRFTCTATSDAGQGAASSSRVVTPTGT